MPVGKYLLVGDIHAQVQDLSDCRRLFDGINEIAELVGPDITVILLGDLHDSHSTIRLEVTKFYQDQLQKLSCKVRSIVLMTGNHDISNDSSMPGSALDAYRHLPVSVVGWCERLVLDSKVVVVSFCHTKDLFVKNVIDSGCNLVIAHQTFVGARYDNGFYAPDGFDLNELNGTKIISGHIHTAQQFSNVNYIGSPRWRTQSDAGVQKKLVLVDENLNVIQEFDTSKWCSQIIRVIETVDNVKEISQYDVSKDRIFVDIIGPRSFLDERAKVWGTMARIRSFEEKTQNVKVSEREGIDAAFEKYLSSLDDSLELRELCQKRKLV